MTTIEILKDVGSAFSTHPNDAVLMKQAASELEALQKEVEGLKKALKSETRRDGKWIDEWGSCRTCGGEIPHGHTETCDVHKLQMKERDFDSLRTQNQELREAVEIANGCEVTNHHVELFKIDYSKHACGCEVCSKSTRLCPATQSSIAQEIFRKALAQPEVKKEKLETSTKKETCQN